MTVLCGAHIELWVEERGGTAAVNPVMHTLLDDLVAAGASIGVRVPELELIDPERLRHTRRPDLVLLKTATSFALSVAIADECYGVRCLNGARATLRAHDKAATLARLAAAGVPVPETYLVDCSAALTSAGQTGGWVTKPTRGVHGHGLQLHVRFPEGMIFANRLEPNSSYVTDDGTRLVQRMIGGPEPDLKVYVAGDQCFAGTKQFSNTSFASDRITPEVLTHAETAVVQRVGQALGLRCFGVDLRYENDRAVVIDANPLPGYRGFPAAAAALRIEIERALEPAAAARETFLDDLEHDLRGPLTIIRGEVELVLSQPDATPDERRRSSASVIDHVVQMEHLLAGRRCQPPETDPQ